MRNPVLQKLERVVENPRSSEIDELLFEVRLHGTVALRLTPLRSACQSMLERTDLSLPPTLRWLFTRIQNAGLFPSYFSYLGLELLTSQFNTHTSSSQLARQSFRLIDDLFAQLLEVQDFKNAPERARLEKHIETLHEKSRSLIFTKETVQPSSTDIINISLIPESSIKEELVFLRVLQGSDIVFFSTHKLFAEAIESIVYGDVLQAVLALHWAKCLLEMLMPLLRPLTVIAIADWQAFRDFIDKPSAIQSVNFHQLCTQLALLQRIHQHPRVPKEQHRYLLLSEELVAECLDGLNCWYKAHAKIAGKYSYTDASQTAEGVQWLETQSVLTSL